MIAMATELMTPQDKIAKAHAMLQRDKAAATVFAWIVEHSRGNIGGMLKKTLPGFETRTIADAILDRNYEELEGIIYAIDLGYLTL